MKNNLQMTYNQIDFELLFLTEVLQLESLHYGIWQEGEALTLSNMRKAQERYTDTLIDMIPNDVNTVLDVGCGIGDVSNVMNAKGFRVHALSPDENHFSRFRSTNNNNIKFHKTKFEDLNISDKFDLILMSESQNYFETLVGFRQCLRYLNPGGYLIVSGIFRKNNASNVHEQYFSIRNSEEEYLKHAHDHGFKVQSRTEITQETLPTLALVQKLLHDNFRLCSNMVTHLLGSVAPFRTRLLQFFFSKEINKLKDLIRFYEIRTNPDLFLDHAKYLRILFKLAPDSLHNRE